jgi:DNA-binding LacI/PurR family transcriptional regulator
VEAAIRGLNYNPHGVARSLAAKKTFSIGLPVPRIVILAFSQKVVPARERLSAYLSAHRVAGINVDKGLVCIAILGFDD